MAPWFSSGHHSFHGSHHSSRGSTSGSVPPSPNLPPSFGSQSHHPSALNLSSGAQTPAINDETLDPMDPLFNDSAPSTPAIPTHSTNSSGAVTPFSSGATTPFSTSASTGPAGGYFPAYGQTIPLEIILDNDQLVLRGAGGDSNPAYLSGSVVLTLTESTNIRELTMELRGKAKVQFSEGSGGGAKSHHHTHTVLTHDWSFLQGHKRHSHTLKAGRHVFPFNLMLDGNLPSSIRTYTSDAHISYKLRAHAIRSTFASNFTAHKSFTLLRTYTTEALEFNQTLEIENTWPGKVMYCLTLPHKAFAAGDEIPVSIKFMPLAKGVRVVSVSSVIKEYTLVHTRHSQHPDARVAATAKHEIKRGRAIAVSSDVARPPRAHAHDESSRPGSAANSAPSSPTRQPVSLPQTAGLQRDSSQHRTPGPRRPADSYFPSMSSTDEPVASGSNADASASTSSLVTRESSSSSHETDIELGDDEVDTHITIPIPTWTTPSHSVHPVFVSHKIKWSCSISNADGHVSELRCALPILIIANPLLTEAHAAGAQTRALLFGGAAAAEAQQIDLPSYNNHVYDRVASLEPGMSNAGFTTRSVHQTPMPSPSDGTPPHSGPPSRPGSPTRGLSRGEYAGDVPPRPQLSSWADSELLLSLGALGRDNSNPASSDNSPTATPPDSRTPSRPGSRSGFRGRNSNPSSRAGSRASSPERGDEILRPEPTRRQSHGLHGLFHMPAIKPMKAFTAIGGGKPGSGTTSPPNGLQRSSQSFTNVQQANTGLAGRSHLAGSSQLNSRSSGDLYNQRFATGGAGAGPSGLRTPGLGPPETTMAPEVDPLSQVPSYAIASRGFLGGGVTPLNSGLPTYDEAEGQQRGAAITRARSEGDLTALAAAADEEDPSV